MRQYMISGTVRFFFLFVGSVLWLGMWLTGLSSIHWLLYIPATLFYFAAFSGICPGLIISRLICHKCS